MTDRISHFVVGLAEDTRDDDVAEIVTALGMVKGVIDVRPVVADYTQALAESRVRSGIRLKLHQAVRDIVDPPAEEARRG